MMKTNLYQGTRSWRKFAAAVVGAVALTACAGVTDSPTAPLVPEPSLGSIPANPSPNLGVADIEFFEVCKYYRGGTGPDVTVDVSVSGTSAPQSFQVTLADGQCKDVWLSGDLDAVTVTEQVPAGYTASFVKEVKTRTSYTADPEAAGNSASGNVSGNPGEGTVVKFYNTVIPPTGAIGNFVWVDANGNGAQDAGEPGIPGVTVTLSGAASATTTTNANGGYLFSGLSAGSYTVTVGAGIPAGYTPTASNQGAPNLDSNGSPAAVTLATNSSVDLTIDFGYLPPQPPAGCTYTQGYWKTHSLAGPAPYDDGWQNLPGGLEQNTIFFTSGKTWLALWNTPPKGSAYIQLAHQYMAAKLNVLNGASAPANVLSAITAAEAYFAAGGVGNITGLATLLDNYNNGLIGPGHCG